MRDWRRTAAFAAASALVVVALSGLGCGRNVRSLLAPNQAPQLEIVDARVDPATHSGIRVRGSGRDPDGRIASYRWSLRPFGAASPATASEATTRTECVVATAVPMRSANEPREPQLFTLQAVDDAGAV